MPNPGIKPQILWGTPRNANKCQDTKNPPTRSILLLHGPSTLRQRDYFSSLTVVPWSVWRLDITHNPYPSPLLALRQPMTDQGIVRTQRIMQVLNRVIIVALDRSYYVLEA